MGEVEEDSDSSSEESDDDDGIVAAAKVSPCLHGPASPSPFTPGSPVSLGLPTDLTCLVPGKGFGDKGHPCTPSEGGVCDHPGQD